jgi:hypothetical protein
MPVEDRVFTIIDDSPENSYDKQISVVEMKPSEEFFTIAQLLEEKESIGSIKAAHQSKVDEAQAKMDAIDAKIAEAVLALNLT